jgi:hypothetical protein
MEITRRTVLGGVGIAAIASRIDPVSAADDRKIQSITVNFDVTGDKKKETGLSITVYAPNGTPLAASGNVSGSGDQSDFWPAGRRFYDIVKPTTDFRASQIPGARLHIESGNPDEWHTHVEADVLFTDGTTRNILQETDVVGFNWNGQNGQPFHDFTLY